jgi:hypothetical protein
MVMSPPWFWPLTDCTTNYRPVLSSERAPQDEEQKNCPAKEKKKKNLVMNPKGVTDTKTDRPTDRRSQHQPNSFWRHISRARPSVGTLRYGDVNVDIALLRMMGVWSSWLNEIFPVKQKFSLPLSAPQISHNVFRDGSVSTAENDSE